MRCEGFPIENYSFFVLGSLPEDEEAEIRAHLKQGCEVCQAEVKRSQALWHAVALSSPPVEPGPALGRRILGMVRPVRTRWFGWRWPQAITTAALAIGAYVTGSVLAPKPPEIQVQTVSVPAPANALLLESLEKENATLKSEIAKEGSVGPASGRPGPDPEIRALRAQLAQANQDSGKLATDLAAAQRAIEEANRKYLAALQPPPAAPAPTVNSDETRQQTAALRTRAQELERQVAEYKVLLAAEHRRLENTLQLASLLTDPNLSLVRLRGTEKGRNVEGHALVTAGSQVVFYASQLPALPAGRTYQLWLIRAQSPAIVSAGTFSPDARSRATLQFANGSLTSGITAIAVTEEPAGGSQQPTGQKLLVGQKTPAA